MGTNHTLGHLFHALAALIVIGWIVMVIRDMRRTQPARVKHKEHR
ncbi:hypothetical protein ACFW2D_10055 [Streptomyces sp. NPDC058914]